MAWAGKSRQKLQELDRAGLLGPTANRNGWREGSGLFPYLSFFTDAFWDLHADRHDGGPIPWTALDAYARRYGIHDLTAFERFAHFLRALDNSWLSVQAQIREANRKHGR